MERFRLKQRFPGLRLAAFVFSSVVGSLAALAVPLGLIGVLVYLAQSGAPLPGQVVFVLALLGMASFGVSLHVLGLVVSHALKLRAPWGDLALGRDGLAWESLFGRRFLPWSAVGKSKASAEELRVRASHGRGTTLGVDDPKAVGAALERAKSSARGELAIPDVLKGAEPEAWLAAVRELGVGGYRQAVTDETLVAVLEHPATPPLPRLGAALALAKREPARVRVVLDDLADDETKAALEAALESEPTAATVKRLAKRS